MVIFPEISSLQARALNLGERFDMKKIKKDALLTMPPLVLNVGQAGFGVIFRYGVVVVFNVNETEERSLLEYLRQFLFDEYEKIETEELRIRIDDAKEEQITALSLSLRSITVSHIQVIADVLAKSVVLAHYESEVGSVFDRVEPLAKDLGKSSRVFFKDQDVLKHIGGALQIEHKLVGRAQVGEKPDVLWEFPQLERIYLKLSDDYEIDERQIAIERKLSVVSRTAETLLDLMQNRRSLRVEWYIVALIVFEIVLTIYELFFRH
ncbi:MAG: RMD1 family protein [Chloroherpetonaceae bacterium]|nr:RMD1 family protein [Chloroherpetonaceae bacterium]